jgi:exosortase/archaeosortase family protein
VPPATASAPTPARRFALRLTVWSLGLFGVFRLSWVGTHILLPATQLQAAAGAAMLGPSALPIEATLACSGADALALCLAAIVAYPAHWRMRAAGVSAGTAVVLALNTIRIGTLGRAAASPLWFHTLHVYIWPAVLTVAIAGLVFGWMREADRLPSHSDPPSAKAEAEREEHRQALLYGPHTLRFALVTVTCLLFFTLAAPLYLGSPRVLALAVLVARAAAFLLRSVGVAASASAGILTTSSGGAFLVTQECLATPLIPVYFAAVLVFVRPWPRAALWVAASVPVFLILGVARLLVVAVPAGLGRPHGFLVHAFSQLLVAIGMVGAAAVWRHGRHLGTYARTAGALALAVAFVQLLGAPYTHVIVGAEVLPFADPQGALMFLPAFQFGLFLALWTAAFAASGWMRFACAASLLAATQIAVGAGAQLAVARIGMAPMVRDVRAWALVGPVLVIAMVVNIAPARR